MDKKLFGFTMLSVRRRWREVIRTCIAAFLAVFFVTGILIFEENMFEWQVASNKDRFGNWFIMEANVSKQSEYFVNHPKLDGYAEALSAVTLYNDRDRATGSMVGYMSEDFLDMGCINVVEGRFPKADNEVAMDWNTLVNIGITEPSIGQTITIKYYEGNLWGKDKKVIQEQMVLVGILEDYSNVWYKSRHVPGALVTKSKYESFNYNCVTAYIYKLDDAYRNSDYRAIYEEILSGTNLKPAYNMYVYDFKPWNSENVYNYMYVLVMVIGIAALTYQLLVYNSSRAKSYELMGKLGASKTQIGVMAFTENALMLVPAGILGIVGAALVGLIVCTIIGLNMGVSFYYIDMAVLAKGLLSIVIAVLVELVISRVITIKKAFAGAQNVKKAKKTSATATQENGAQQDNKQQDEKQQNKKQQNKKEQNSKQGKKFKSKLNRRNAIRTISFRFTGANKIAQNLGVRIFSLGVGVIIIMCALRIYDTYTLYDENKDNIDLIGTFEVQNAFSLDIPYYVSYAPDGSDGSDVDGFLMEEDDPSDYQVTPTKEQIEQMIGQHERVIDVPGYGKIYTYGDKYITIPVGENRVMSQLNFSVFKGAFYNEPRTNITQGIGEYVRKNMESINGVESVLYGTYENQRTWNWDGMNLGKMGYDLLTLKRGTPSEDGGSDNSQMSIYPYASRDIYGTEYVTPTEELYNRLCKYIDPSMQDYEAFAKGEQVVVFIEDNPRGKYDDSLTAGKTINYDYYDLLPNRYSSATESATQYILNNDEEVLRYMVVHGIPYSKSDYEWYDTDWYNKKKEILRKSDLTSCVQTKAAAVVHMSDEIKEEFSDVIANNAYYLAIASTKLAQKACEEQDKIVAELLELSPEELPEECKMKITYNQIIVKYNLLSTISATDNILSTYCEQNGITFTSYAAVNEKYRTDFINAVLQYGITIVAVIVINMLICAVVARNRLETRKQRIELLLRLGAEKKAVRKIFMIEAFRESLWCLFTLPIVLVIQGVIYRRDI